MRARNSCWLSVQASAAILDSTSAEVSPKSITKEKHRHAKRWVKLKR